MKLAALQTALARHVVQGSLDETLPTAIRDGGASRETRLAVYRELVEEVHLDALAQVYPVSRAVVGDGYWRTLIRSTWDGPGAPEIDLGAYGAFVPPLLAAAVQTRPELAEFDYLPELARLEWAIHEVAGRTGPERFDWARFAALPEAEQADVRLLPSPALSKLRLDSPVDEIWRRHHDQAKREPGEHFSGLCCLHPVGRFEIAVSRWRLDEEALLDQLLAGPRLASLTTLESKEGLARLHGWIEQGWIIGFAMD